MSLLSVLFFNDLSGQFLDQSQFDDFSVRNIGPAGMSGRITAIDVDNSDTDRIFVGSASGGVWKSENGGVSWEAIFDDQASLSIGSLKINQNNPDEIWVGTGEGNPRNSMNVGYGIYHTIDGGKTWKCMGLENTRVIHRIIIHKDDPKTVFVGATGSPWGDSSDRGVYRTTNGGKTWDRILYVDQKTGVADMVVDPSNPNKILVAMWEHRRTPWDFVSGGKSSGLYLTYDGGQNWTKLGEDEGMPKGDLGRIGLAYAPSKPEIVYALIEAEENGLYKSIDGGANWSLVSKENIGNRPFYYSEIYVDPQNENRIYNLWSYVSKSEDGGKSFETIMDYGNSVHPDHHAFWIDSKDPTYLINGNDGGLNISRDRGESWRFVANLPVGQFYHVNVDDDFPYNVYGGMQDNGSWVGPGFVLKRGGIRNYDWQELYFGDGFDVAPNPENSRYGYAMSQGGNLAYYDREMGRTRAIRPYDVDSTELRFNWNAPLAIDPFNSCGVYYGSQFVHYSSDCGDSWVRISPDLTTNDTTKQKQDVSGGLTIDATNAENHTTLICIAPSTLDEETVWASSDDGLLHVTRDGGKNWTKVSSRLTGLPAGSWIPQIRLTSKEGEAFVVANNYRRNDYTAYAYHTMNYGQSWTRIADDRQVKGFVTSILQDPEEENLLFLGTDVGLYFSMDKGRQWQRWDNDLPHVQVRDMAFQDTFDDLVLGTFGRSFWILDDIESLRTITRNKSVLNKDFAILGAPDSYMTSMRSYDGIRFIAQGEYIGDNKGLGAVVHYWVKPKKEEKSEKKGSKKKGEDKTDTESKTKKDGKIYVAVLDMKGDTIRQYSRKGKEGFHKIGWDRRKEGVNYPSRKKPKKDAEAPRGYEVLPGKYKLILSYNGSKDSVEIDIKKDPRSSTTMEDLEAINAVYDQYYLDVERATDGMHRIIDAKNQLSLVKKLLEVQTDTTSANQLKTLKDLQKGLKKLERLYFMPEGLKGIQRDPNVLTNQLYGVNYFVGSSWTKPGKNAMLVFSKTTEKVNKTLEKVNTFFTEEFDPFRKEVENRSLNPFLLKD